MPFLNLSESKKGANLMARRYQQIDASHFVYSIARKIAACLKINASQRALLGFCVSQHPSSGGWIEPSEGTTMVDHHGIIRAFLS